MPAKKKISKKKQHTEEKNIENIVDENIQVDEEVDELDFDVDVDEFFDEKNFEDFGSKINFHVFNPEKYENVIHTEIIIIPNIYRRTSEIITKYEFTNVISIRAKQIENGSKIFTECKNITEPIEMAKLEIKHKKCPLSIRRMISNNIAEIWDINDMIIPYIN